MKILWKLFCAFYVVFFAFGAFDKYMLGDPWCLLYMFFAACYVAFLFEKN